MLIRPCRWPLTDILSRSCAWKKPFLETEGGNKNFHKEGERCLSLRVLIIHSFWFLLTTNWSKMKKRCKNYVTINITLLLNYVNQIDSMLLCVFINRSQKIGTHLAVECVNDVLSIFSRHLWPITGQTNSNMECMCKRIGKDTWFFQCIRSITKIFQKPQKLRG